MDSITLPPDQTRIYVGPLDDDVIGSDLQQQFVQFGAIRGVSRYVSGINYSNPKKIVSHIFQRLLVSKKIQGAIYVVVKESSFSFNKLQRILS
jgi:hypothetical protein